MTYFPDRIEMSSVDGDKAWYVLESEHKRTVDQTWKLGTQVEELTEKLCDAKQALALEKLTSEGLRETVDLMAREADGLTRDRDAYRDMLRRVIEHQSAERAWARSAGITLNAVGDILSRLDDANISRGRAVELLRELAVAAVEERTRERDEAVARYTSAEEQIDRLQRGDTIESDFITASECRLLVERDEARRELRALEWLHKPHRDGSSAWFNENGKPCRYEDWQWVTWNIYAEAATALGWKDAP